MRISDWSSDVCSSDLRRVAKNDGYVLLRQLDASEVSDDDLSAGIGFGDSGDIGINIYTIGRQMLRDCAQEAAGATGRLDHTNMPEPIEHVVSEHFGRPEGREPLVKIGISALRVQRREALLIEKNALRGPDQPVVLVDRKSTRLNSSH